MASVLPSNGTLTVEVTTVSGNRDGRGNLTPVTQSFTYQVYVELDTRRMGGAGGAPGTEVYRTAVKLNCVEPMALHPSIVNGQKGRLRIADPSGLQPPVTDEVVLHLQPPDPWGLTSVLGQELEGYLVNMVIWNNA